MGRWQKLNKGKPMDYRIIGGETSGKIRIRELGIFRAERIRNYVITCRFEHSYNKCRLVFSANSDRKIFTDFKFFMMWGKDDDNKEVMIYEVIQVKLGIFEEINEGQGKERIRFEYMMRYGIDMGEIGDTEDIGYREFVMKYLEKCGGKEIQINEI